MKTTYPKKFKAKSECTGEIIEGNLTYNGHRYSISFLSRVDTVLSQHDGVPILLSTLQWQCANCDMWNVNDNLSCKHCDLKLGR